VSEVISEWWRVVIVVALAIILIGCGSSNGSGKSATTAPTEGHSVENVTSAFASAGIPLLAIPDLRNGWGCFYESQAATAVRSRSR